MKLRPRHILAAMLGLAVVAACGSLALADTLNSFRHAHGLAPLQHSRAMQAMAQRHANSMAARHSMDHDGFYTQRAPRGARAENVGWGCPTAGCVMKLWEESAGHRANMLRSDVHSYGLASAARGGQRYWCMELGR
jgi:uncharacterized protein YkwD